MPRISATCILWPLLGAMGLAVGCAAPNAQATRLQSEKQELVSAVEKERADKKDLEQKAASLEARLDQSEKEIARLTGRKSNWDEGDLRSASSKNSSAPASSATKKLPAGAKQNAEPIEQPLPWRALRNTQPSVEDKPSPLRQKRQAGVEAKPIPTVRSLAQRDSRLHYDAATDTARYQVDIPFEESGAGLTAEGRKRLDDLASWLKAEQTKELRVLVSGSSTGMKKPKAGDDKPRFANDRQLGAARAGAVADYLDRHGITADRLVVVGSGGPKLDIEETSTSPVQIHLADAKAPVMGLVPKQPALRR